MHFYRQPLQYGMPSLTIDAHSVMFAVLSALLFFFTGNKQLGTIMPEPAEGTENICMQVIGLTQSIVG